MACARFASALLGMCLIACGESADAASTGSLDHAARKERERSLRLPDESVGLPVVLRDAGAEDSALPDDVEPEPPPPPATAGSGGATEEVDAALPDEPEQPQEQPDADITVSVCGLLGSLLCPEGSECVDGTCTQLHRCAADEDCEPRCTGGEACAVECDAANKCKAECGASATCDVSCVGANNCEAKCTHGACAIDCEQANNCDHVRCGDDAQCIVFCGEETNCKIEDCAAPEACPGNVLVCNRPCP